MIVLYVSIFIWIAIGIYVAGKNYAHYQEDFPLSARDSRISGLIFSLLWGIVTGLIGLFTLAINGELNHKWRLR